MHRKTLLTAALAAPLALAVASPAAAAVDENEVVLVPVGEGGAAGTAALTLDEEADSLAFRLAAEGLEPELPLAAYLASGGEGICPPEAVATGAEAAEFVGEPLLLLSTEGDVAPEPVVDVDRVPVVTEDGEVVIERTYDLAEVDPFGVEDVVVVGYAVTDPETPVEELAPVFCGTVSEAAATSAPASPSTDDEATPPADEAATSTDEATSSTDEEMSSTDDDSASTDDGTTATGDQVTQVPVGGVEAGGGGTAGIEHEGLFALGGAALLGAGAIALRRRGHEAG